MDRQSRRRRRTEDAIILAAAELFVRHGYSKTSITDVAMRADVAERTIYLRFGTKVRLFQRVIEFSVVGDAEAIPLTERPWSVIAFTAPTLRERVVAFAEGVGEMNERLAPLMAVNGEVEMAEPDVQESARKWRNDTVEFLQAFWRQAAADALLPPESDVEWLAETGMVLSAAESRLLITRSLQWDRATYSQWLVTTWLRLAGVSTSL
ncbi:TetR/AcrR family transcriptional regulator [Leifsonia flava]|uniref:TetR/AcrR family transcriptional regulator n=1 Tax=Orlajensenia leifsoniae TaxID=2561933 RepID=UPI0014308782|nr:TetR/AcrR family transcriptional regulator [Leifsonia flava]